jgi:F-type H+-transporting ATPase subunit gamma
MEVKEIKREIESVRNIWKLTGALETLSALKMKKSQKIALLSRPFAEKTAEFLERLKADPTEEQSFFFTKKKEGKVLVLVLASDKGFCGPFNYNVLRFSIKEIEVLKKENDVEILPVGKKAISFFKNRGVKIDHSFFGIGDFGELEDVEKISEFLVADFIKGVYKEVYVFYTGFISTFSQKPEKFKLLPLEKEAMEEFLKETSSEQKKERIEFLIEPSYKMFAAEVVPQLVEYLLYQAVLEANASEHSARMMAMRNASENAEEKVTELNLTYNKARQEQITKEVCEVSSAKEVLS